MFDRFTGQARRVVWLAYQEAQRFDHDFLGTEHLLIGVLREGSPEVLTLLRQHGVEPDNVLTQIDPVLLASEPAPSGGTIYLTPRARQILAAAHEEADRAHAPQAGVAHLLLALLADRESETQRILDELGVDLDGLRKQLRSIPTPVNRDLSVRRQRADTDPARVDPSAEQLAQLLSGQMPHADLSPDTRIAAEGTVPGIAELDWQLLLTQLMLAVTAGVLSGYLMFGSGDGMAAITSILFVVAIFRNSLLGAVAGGFLAYFIARRIDREGSLPFLLPWLGAFIGSFLGNFWRRYCPFVVKAPAPAPEREKVEDPV